MYKFLIGLNNKFEPVRIQVLGKDLSSLNEIMIVYHAEEYRRGVMLEPHELKVQPCLYKIRGRKLDKGRLLHLEMR